MKSNKTLLNYIRYLERKMQEVRTVSFSLLAAAFKEVS
jgi:hypothetical protein